ncbi:chorismate synthase [Guyanagaster necrorhizus]|uniref:Chorismate synthase n=1 Tax=Guyanagaster necrorhizus TaxID=856835 RepID=A0A9P8AWN8_9AGAR|nr:chorismate synthase [Guyanagaster necrorhizus MCA 3950]KAG7450768.1 chorismate synthase [Guyanagaster necrorhizus MCA 3950]
MSTFGHIFRVTTYGESHCASVGAIIDGCPPGLNLEPSDIQVQLNRRRPGQSNLTTPRNEKDLVHLQSGIEYGVTLGTPISLLVKNEDQRPHDYSETDLYPRPSHADYTYLEKYGIKASSGGGRSSARETIGRVAAGAIAEKYLKLAYGIEVVAFVSSVGKIHLPSTVASPSSSDADNDDAQDAVSEEFKHLLATVTREQVDSHPIRCPHPETAERMTQRIVRAKDAMDSIGGTITCVIRNVPPGLGEPVFDKFEATLGHAMLSIPATKAFEIGSGFKGTEVPGSKHNDPFVKREDGRLGTKSNWSGGVQGGITNGEDIYFRIGFKSPATISQAQETAQYDGTPGSLAARGRHDPCVVPRAVPIVEAMACIVIMDQLLIQNARKTAASLLPPVTTLPSTMVLRKKTA